MSGKTAVGGQEKALRKAKSERWLSKMIEGARQCPRCGRFMRLGEAMICLGERGTFEEAAEIICFLPADCPHYTEAERPFENRGAFAG